MSRKFSLVFLVILVVLLTACGGAAEAESSGPETAADAVATPPGDVSGLTFAFVPANGQTPTVQGVNNALEQGLVSAGFRLVTGLRTSADATLQVNVMAAEERSFFQMSVNGQTTRKEHVTVTLAVRGASQVLDQLRTEFSCTNGEVKIQDVSKIVAEVSRSPRLAQYMQDRRRQLAEIQDNQRVRVEAEKRKVETEAAEKARLEEETAWNAARVTGCKLPASLAACDGLRLYLAKYPEGVHAEEGKKAIEDGQPKLETLQKDDNTWRQAGVAACRSRTAPDACVGVELYVSKYPSGLHADEARALLDKN